jgi:hypothetical protein
MGLRLSPGILSLAERGRECLGFFLNAFFRKKLVGLSRSSATRLWDFKASSLVVVLPLPKQREGHAAMCGTRRGQTRQCRTGLQAPFAIDYTGNGAFGQ